MPSPRLLIGGALILIGGIIVASWVFSMLWKVFIAAIGVGLLYVGYHIIFGFTKLGKDQQKDGKQDGS